MKDKVVSKTNKQTSASKGSKKSVKDRIIVKQADGSEKIIDGDYVIGDGIAPLRARDQNDAESIAEHENSLEDQDGVGTPRGPAEGRSGVPFPGKSK